MRIIGGALGRRIIRPPAGIPVRPTTDKAKEALFNILKNYVDFEDLRVLDLFAGTGSISYEFASRGAKQVVAVDNNVKCVRFMQKVKQEYELDKLVVYKADALKYIVRAAGKFDLVFCDPPYDMAGIAELPDRIFSKEFVDTGGLLVVEHPANIIFDSHPFFSFKRNYSKVHFSFFEP